LLLGISETRISRRQQEEEEEEEKSQTFLQSWYLQKTKNK
jgi:hypothetical protein